MSTLFQQNVAQINIIKNNHMGIHFEMCLVYYLLIWYKVKKRSHDWISTLLVCLCVSPSLCLVRFCQPLRYTDNRIVNIMIVYIERNNLQVELIRYSNKCWLYSRYFCEATDSMQYRPPNVNEFPEKKHVGSVSDSLGRHSAASECMASVK